jgi:hypothetical protein
VLREDTVFARPLSPVLLVPLAVGCREHGRLAAANPFELQVHLVEEFVGDLRRDEAVVFGVLDGRPLAPEETSFPRPRVRGLEARDGPPGGGR